MHKQYEERLIAIVQEIFVVDAAKVTPTASLINDLGGDSLDAVELVMAVEGEFGIEIPDDVAEKCITVQDYIDTVNAALNNIRLEGNNIDP